MQFITTGSTVPPPPPRPVDDPAVPDIAAELEYLGAA